MHVIRLRKPWLRAREPGGAIVLRVDVPDLEPAEDGADDSLLVYRRKFNRPSRLSTARVYLSISDWQGCLNAVVLNDVVIVPESASTGFREEITSLLRPHNELVVHLSADQEYEPRLTGEVMLVIEEPAPI